MDLTKLQLSELMCNAAKGNGLHDLMEIMIESMMVAERGEFLADNPGNKGNGYRPGSTYGQGENLSSVSLETATATSIHKYSPYSATRKRNAIGSPESFIQRGLLRNRLVTYSTRYTAGTTQVEHQPYGGMCSHSGQ